MHTVAGVRPLHVKARLSRVQDAQLVGSEKTGRSPRVCLARHYRELVPYEQACHTGNKCFSSFSCKHSNDNTGSCVLQACSFQKELVAKRCQDQSHQDTILLLQHPAVYTLGAGSTTNFLKFDESSPPYPLYRSERGGEVTYHGPGQLVMYPILNLRHHKADMHWYMRSLEEIMIRSVLQ